MERKELIIQLQEKLYNLTKESEENLRDLEQKLQRQDSEHQTKIQAFTK